ncbi:MAG: anthranilate synthase family protein [Alphaproteobacteria bacterium]|nr:anthranilate synthase family protein [Alphaproteobacteria bacterium]
MFVEAVNLARSFALFEKDGRVLCVQGPVHTLESIDEIHTLARKTERDVAFVLPYRAIRERGFEAHGDEPILAIEIETALSVPSETLVRELDDVPLKWNGTITPSMSDEDYAALVKRFQENEIEKGNASQVTLARLFSGCLDDFDTKTALSLYKKILMQKGQYMAVLFANLGEGQTNKKQFILGATPERHLEIQGNETLMAPIAGTLRKEDRETFETRLDAFLKDPKEVNELFQVVDEEMKIMGVICPDGGEVEGPFLREVGAVVHTEYRLVGRRGRDTMAALRRTLHAPTVVGSPMESAARIIHKYEGRSRRYYAGEIGIYRNPRTDSPNGDVDCAILIRCAEIDGTGAFRVQAGGGLVRDSVPANEAKESRAKALGLLGMLTGAAQLQQTYMTDELRRETEPVLRARNRCLSSFWMNRQDPHAEALPSLAGTTVTILNNEDDFAFMLAHMLRTMHADVRVIDSLAFDPKQDASDLVLVGPGPGDPTDMTHPRMKALQDILSVLSAERTPVLGICLGHQALAVSLEIDVQRQAHSTQGMQRLVSVQGKDYRLGFYNSFSPVFNDAAARHTDIRFDLDENKRIIAMEGAGFIGFQFHPESIMSEKGADLLHRAIMKLRYA